MSIGGLRDSMTVAVQKIGELGEAINDHADHFATHHNGVSWLVRKVKTLDQDVRAELTNLSGRLQSLSGKFSEVEEMKRVIEENDRLLKQKFEELSTNTTAAVQGLFGQDAALAQAVTGLGGDQKSS